MANSFVRYTGNGSTDAFAVPFSYRAQEDVSVTINGVTTTAFTWNGAGTTITFTTAPLNLTSIEIRRTTSQAARLIDYADGSVLKENDLDTDSFQGFYMGQEAIDDANDKILLDAVDFQWDAGSKRIKNVADPVNTQDVVTLNYIQGTFTDLVNDTTPELGGDLNLNGKNIDFPTTVNISDCLDEDNMASDSATKLATQQSIKAYVDTQVATVPVGDITSVVAGAGLTGGGTSSDVTLNVVGGAGITANANDITIDSSVVTLTDSQILTSKTITSPIINTGVSGTAILDEDTLSSDSATQLATQQSIKAYVDGKSHLSLIDEDNFATDSATRPPSQQSVKAYVDGQTHLSLIDEDNFATDSATRPPSQQSVKAYVDGQAHSSVTASSTTTFTGKTIDANGTGNSITNLEVADLASGVLDTDITSVSGSDDTLASAKAIKTYVDAQTHLSLIDEDNMVTDSATRPPSQQSVKAYVDAVSTLSLIDEDDMSTDSATRPPSQQSVKAYVDGQTHLSLIDEDTMSTDSATRPPSQQSVKAYVDGQTHDSGIDDIVEDTTPELGGDLGLNGNSIDFPTTANISDCLDEDTMSSNSATKLATQQSIKAYVDAQSHLSLIDEDNFATDSATRPPSQQSVKAYADTKASTGDATALAVALG